MKSLFGYQNNVSNFSLYFILFQFVSVSFLRDARCGVSLWLLSFTNQTEAPRRGRPKFSVPVNAVHNGQNNLLPRSYHVTELKYMHNRLTLKGLGTRKRVLCGWEIYFTVLLPLFAQECTSRGERQEFLSALSSDLGIIPVTRTFLHSICIIHC